MNSHNFSRFIVDSSNEIFSLSLLIFTPYLSEDSGLANLSMWWHLYQSGSAVLHAVYIMVLNQCKIPPSPKTQMVVQQMGVFTIIQTSLFLSCTLDDSTFYSREFLKCRFWEFRRLLLLRFENMVKKFFVVIKYFYISSTANKFSNVNPGMVYTRNVKSVTKISLFELFFIC